MTEQKTALPEDNPRSHELFAEFEAVVAKMRDHRPDDLVGAWHNLATVIELTEFPRLIVDTDAETFTCPYCGDELEHEVTDGGDYWLVDLRFHDWDTASYNGEVVHLPDDAGFQISAPNDRFVADWGYLYADHQTCGGAISIPPEIHVEFS